MKKIDELIKKYKCVNSYAPINTKELFKDLETLKAELKEQHKDIVLCLQNARCIYKTDSNSDIEWEKLKEKLTNENH